MGWGEPRAGIGTYPTPIERVSVAGAPLFIKRDDLIVPAGSALAYGGNKVRKLEYLLGAAVAARRSRLVTLGAAGSHQVIAMTLYGSREGFETEAVLAPQASSEHARDNLRAALARGLHAVAAPSWPAAPALAATRVRRDAYFVPLGGSNVTGTLGFVDAGVELAAQVAAGALPEPSSVVVALGSGGTAAGLAVGFELAGMRTRVVGVVISPPIAVLTAMARRLVKKTGERVGLPPAAVRRALERLEVDRRWLGRGYGYATREADAATREAEGVGLSLDPAYTAKAFACALDLARTSGPVVYWHTLSSAPIAPLVERAPPLPPALERLFR